jgi:hypothetical protein
MGLIHEIVPCKELIGKIEREAEQIIGGLQKLVVRSSKL